MAKTSKERPIPTIMSDFLLVLQFSSSSSSSSSSSDVHSFWKNHQSLPGSLPPLVPSVPFLFFFFLGTEQQAVKNETVR